MTQLPPRGGDARRDAHEGGFISALAPKRWNVSDSTRRSALWLLAFLVPAAILAVHQWGWAPPENSGDYAQYLMHAKALVEGRPYGDTAYIFRPEAWQIGPSTYPPGLPLTLAPIVALGGVHTPLIRLLSLGSLLVFVTLAWRRLSMSVAGWQAAVGAGFTAFVVVAHQGTLAPTSDVGFAALVWAMVLVVDTTLIWNWSSVVLVTILGGAVLGYRMAGLGVVGAFSVFAVITVRRSRGLALVPVACWAFAAALAFALGFAQLSDVKTIADGWLGPASNIRMFRDHYIPAAFAMTLRPADVGYINQPYHVVAALVMLSGLVTLAWRLGAGFLTISLVGYLLMLLAAPVAEERYLWVWFPIGACALAVGLAQIIARLRRWWPSLRVSRVSGALLGVVFAAALFTQLREPPPTALVSSPDGEALFAWLRQANREKDMRLAFFNPRVMGLETGIPTMGNVNLPADEQLRLFTEVGITHLVCRLGEPADAQEETTNSLPDLYPDRLSLSYENARFRVYRFLNDDGSPSDSN